MNWKSLTVVFYAACTVSSMAQTSGTPANPMNGTWTGHMGQDGTIKSPLTIELKVDGGSFTGTVSGPPFPGEIKTGSFDQATGALKFDVYVKDGDNAVVTFEGTAVQGTAVGRVIFPNRAGYFKLTKGSAGSGGGQAPADDMAAAVRKSFGEVSGMVTKAAELVPADKYDYRPAPTVKTFGQLVGHLADAYDFYCGRAAGRKVQWSEATEKGPQDKATLTKKLKASLDACNAVDGNATGYWEMVNNIAHTNLHYGNMVTYIRMLGLVPPSSN